ncbi:hypothetical protein QJ854_gp949 [Moumouvirus goulette]|uniref:Uncharacterized protein n=1 Tax=Moumouvirus goulette TaxID=1247379 RepID=M1PFR2_9VIRU|nr:hypothetical protein QJ854_gp949 [Moumouvirus goulette]AGF84833.1 hypothetical protein glt_00024 [Moumouvirus goulette]
MKIIDFIDFDSLGMLDYKSIIHCKLDDDHKIYEADEKIPLPNNKKTLSLITKAKKSFVSYKKIKDKYVKGIYDKNLGPIDSINLLIYLSTDKKFYCVNFNYSDENTSLDFMGIFEKNSGKFFTMTHHFSWKKSGIYLCFNNNKYNIIDYDSDFFSDFKQTYKNIYED